MPGYGVAAPNQGEGLLLWSWAEERLSAAHNYWLASTRPDGRPHLMPLWAVWVDGCLLFSTGAGSRKARNLRAEPRCSISTERGDEPVIIEGAARELEPTDIPDAAREAYKAKYGWELTPDLGPIFAVHPSRVFGFIEHEDQFAATATRWTFGQAG
jgi:nitroimidazol reductase NimA-like FMN-containing flavoprotein (pyridoxamine 5'-phosphate oxidase superfamily)